MNPPWLTEEYASMRTMLVWRRARTLPTVIVSADSTQSSGRYTSSTPGKAMKISVMIATKPAAFDATEKNAVTGVGAPSYVSGAHEWNGTAEILNANPHSTNTTATTSRPVNVSLLS